jgi:3-hydroxyacyl-CoA dehydrogenase
MSILLDPTSEHTPHQRQRLPRPVQLTGLTVGLLDISKARGNIFLDRIEEQLTEKGLTVQRYRKPTFARIAPVDLKHQISTECDLVIEALAD